MPIHTHQVPRHTSLLRIAHGAPAAHATRTHHSHTSAGGTAHHAHAHAHPHAHAAAHHPGHTNRRGTAGDPHHVRRSHHRAPHGASHAHAHLGPTAHPHRHPHLPHLPHLRGVAVPRLSLRHAVPHGHPGLGAPGDKRAVHPGDRGRPHPPAPHSRRRGGKGREDAVLRHLLLSSGFGLGGTVCRRGNNVFRRGRHLDFFAEIHQEVFLRRRWCLLSGRGLSRGQRLRSSRCRGGGDRGLSGSGRGRVCGRRGGRGGRCRGRRLRGDLQGGLRIQLDVLHAHCKGLDRLKRETRVTPPRTSLILLPDVLVQSRVWPAAVRPLGQLPAFVYRLGTLVSHSCNKLNHARLPLVHGSGLHLGNVHSQRTVDSRALQTNENPKVRRRPFWSLFSTVKASPVCRMSR
eukprot:RCo034927